MSIAVSPSKTNVSPVSRSISTRISSDSPNFLRTADSSAASMPRNTISFSISFERWIVSTRRRISSFIDSSRPLSSFRGALASDAGHGIAGPAKGPEALDSEPLQPRVREPRKPESGTPQARIGNPASQNREPRKLEPGTPQARIPPKPTPRECAMSGGGGRRRQLGAGTELRERSLCDRAHADGTEQGPRVSSQKTKLWEFRDLRVE